jgi:hypothetical protein
LNSLIRVDNMARKKEELTIVDGTTAKMFIKDVWHRHKEHAVGDAKKRLSKSDVLALTMLSIASAFIITFVDFIIYMRWSTFDSNVQFYTYHPFVPWLIISFNLILIYCFYLKGITFWLVYYPFILGIIYYLIEAALINSWISPMDLANFFGMFGLGNPPGWLIGV